MLILGNIQNIIDVIGYGGVLWSGVLQASGFASDKYGRWPGLINIYYFFARYI